MKFQRLLSILGIITASLLLMANHSRDLTSYPSLELIWQQQYALDEQLQGFAWSPDGRYLAVNTAQLITIYDSAFEIIQTLFPPEGFFIKIIWNPDSQRLAAFTLLDLTKSAGVTSRSLYIYEVSSGEYISVYESEAYLAYDLVWLDEHSFITNVWGTLQRYMYNQPCECYILVSEIGLFSAPNNYERRSPHDLTSIPMSDRVWFITGSIGYYRYNQALTTEELRYVVQNSPETISLSLSPSGEQLLSVGFPVEFNNRYYLGVLYKNIYSAIPEIQPIFPVNGDWYNTRISICCAAWHPDSPWVATMYSEQGVIHLWHTLEWKLLTVLPTPNTATVNSAPSVAYPYGTSNEVLMWHPDGELLGAIHVYKNTLSIWKVSK